MIRTSLLLTSVLSLSANKLLLEHNISVLWMPNDNLEVWLRQSALMAERQILQRWKEQHALIK